MASRYLSDAQVADALQTIAAAAERHEGRLAVSTSFGIHAALMLDLVTRAAPGTPVIFVDTGYLPAETHRFAAELTERFALDLHVARSEMAPADFEAAHGRLWETGRAEDLATYHRLRKVAPMKAMLDTLGTEAWLAGLRAGQTEHRSTLAPVTEQWGRRKYLPVLDWSDRAVMSYINQRDLPMHPLFYEGYQTVGDWHSSRALGAGESDARATRFNGVAEECGLHVAA